MNDDAYFWLAFSYVPGVGSARVLALLDAFGDLEKAWHASRSALRRAGMGPKTVESILRVRSEMDLEAAHRKLHETGAGIIALTSAEYPERLRDIQSPPASLFVRGELTKSDRVAVSVVGTRRASPYGRAMAERIAAGLASMGVTVVSGLARGVDGFAHRAALAAGGRTLAVLGSGVDVIYPAEHRKLAAEISHQGALISEYPPGARPEAHHFPARNRIIAGLALGVVVIEAARRSGALITADFAVEQGKDVFAVPGDLTRKTSEGTNRLIQAGATPVLEVIDILDALQLEILENQLPARVESVSDEVELALLEVLREGPADIDEICQRSGLPVERIQASLSILELKGWIQPLGGRQYLRVQENKAAYYVD